MLRIGQLAQLRLNRARVHCVGCRQSPAPQRGNAPKAACRAPDTKDLHAAHGTISSDAKPSQASVYLRKAELAGVASWISTWSSNAAICAVLATSMACCGDAAVAATRIEPSNALSIPTWIIHVSSVIEWTVAMLLMWRYAEVTGNEKWKGMTWGMLPLFTGALCACTYHLFYNSPDLDFLVALQAGLTWIGNAMLWAAAYRIFRDSRQSAAGQ